VPDREVGHQPIGGRGDAVGAGGAQVQQHRVHAGDLEAGVPYPLFLTRTATLVVPSLRNS
jgi:hypothetical protein